MSWQENVAIGQRGLPQPDGNCLFLSLVIGYTVIAETEGDQMAKKGNTNKAQLKKHCQQVYKALVDLTDLHVWPANRDIAELEGELLEQLDVLEYQLGQDLYDRA